MGPVSSSQFSGTDQGDRGFGGSDTREQQTRSDSDDAANLPVQRGPSQAQGVRAEWEGCEGIGSDEEAPLSQRRGRRNVKEVERLGMAKARPRQTRKPRERETAHGSGVTRLERVGTSAGAMKYLIKAGQRLIRRIVGDRTEEERMEERDAKGDG